MYPRLIRAGLVGTLMMAGTLVAQDTPRPVEQRPAVIPGSFTGARPAGVPGGGLGGSNLGGSPTTGGGIVGGPGMLGGIGGFRGTQKSWHCPRCQRVVAMGVLPPASTVCCGQTFVNGESLDVGADAPALADPAVSTTRPPEDAPPAATSVAPVSDPEPAGNGKLIALGVGILVVGLTTLGVVILLALRMGHGNRPRPRRRRARD